MCKPIPMRCEMSAKISTLAWSKLHKCVSFPKYLLFMADVMYSDHDLT